MQEFDLTVQVLHGGIGGVEAERNAGIIGWQEDRRGNGHFFFLVESSSPANHHSKPVHGKRAGHDCDQRANKTMLLCLWPEPPCRQAVAAAAGARALTRRDRREILRDAVFRWSAPLVTPRRSSGSASRNAARAVSTSPLARASSTLRTNVLMRLMRLRFTAVRFSVWRIRFLAER